jgi:hypothetical protein
MRNIDKMRSEDISSTFNICYCQQWLWRNNTALETCLEDLYLCPLSPISSTQRLSLTNGIVIEIQRNLGRRHPPPFMPSGYDLQWRDFDKLKPQGHLQYLGCGLQRPQISAKHKNMVVEYIELGKTMQNMS